MKHYDNGCFYTVTYSREDSASFARRWPCATVHGAGSFQFDLGGNLVDVTGSASRNDGSDWLAFAEDCQRYGMKRRERE